MERILHQEYGVKLEDIKVLERWDRVHMIRECATKAASDSAADGMERFARGEKTKLRDKFDGYKKRIQAIWERQREFLQQVDEEIIAEAAQGDEVGKSVAQDDDDDDDDDEDAKELL